MTNPTLPPLPSTIANLPAAGNITGSEFVPISQNGITVRTTTASVAGKVSSVTGTNGISASTVAGATTVSGVTATSSQIGVVQPDGTTITSSSGIITSNMVVGTTAISGGTNGRIEYNNNGVLGELVTTGSGSVTLTTSGTWTAAFACGTSGTITINSSAKTGYYQRIGDMVFISGQLQVTSVSSPVGILTITGLPVTCGTTGGGSAISVSGGNLTSGATTSVVGLINPGTTSVSIYLFSAGAQANACATVQATSFFYISGCYPAV